MVVKLNKNSWHYRLCEFVEIDINSSNFCDYFKCVIGSIFIVFALSFLAFILGFVPLYIFINFFILYPIIGVIPLLVYCLFVLFIYLDYKRDTNLDRFYNNIFVSKYRSMKEKYCPGIEWVK